MNFSIKKNEETFTSLEIGPITTFIIITLPIMNTHLQTITQLLKKIRILIVRTAKEILLYYKDLTKKQQIAVAGVSLLLLTASAYFIITHKATEDVVAVVSRKVTVASILLLSESTNDFPLVGTVTSASEATIRSETGGKFTRVYKKLGDSIYAGGIIAEFENSGERAALLQAEGVYEQAKASRDIAGLNSGQAGTSLGDTKSQALNTISNAYIGMDDAVRGKTDAAFTSPTFEEAKLVISVPDAYLSTSLEVKRRSIEKMLRMREQRNKTLTQASDLVTELNAVQLETQMVKAYLDDLFTAYSKALPDSAFSQSSLDAGKTSTQIARQAITGMITSVVTSRASLNVSLTANQVAGGGSQSAGTLASSDAQVKQALGAYNAALSRLEKTIVRSPITGTLNSLSITTGDYVGAFTQIAIVSNNGALEIISSVTEDDSKRITVGSVVTIDGTVQGVVTRIASAIDPTTKKIEVRIGIRDTHALLINGQSVRILIAKAKSQTPSKVSTSPIVIPLSALKLTPRGANVYVVSSSSTLIAISVHEGAILGEQIQILSGLTGTEEIVVDARGLKEGLTVEVTQ